MAESLETYDITNDMPGGAVHTATLEDEILASSITTILNRIDTDGGTFSRGVVTGGTLNIFFADPLSGPEGTTLDGDTTGPAGGLLAAHDNSLDPLGTITDGTITFDTEIDNGTSGATPTIDWTSGQKQKITLNAATVTFTFTAPPGLASGLILKIINMNDRTLVWPGTVLWPGGTTPTASAGATDTDLYSFYYDGTNYYGGVLKDYS